MARRRVKRTRERKQARYAGFPIRLAATIIDFVIIAVISAILVFIPVINLLVWLVSVAYYTYFEGKQGATPGKRVLDLKVVGEKGAFPIGYPTALIRWIGRAILLTLLFFSIAGAFISVIPFAFLSPLLLLGGVVSGLLGLIGFIGFLWIIVDEKKQSWYDKLAGTYVVHT